MTETERIKLADNNASNTMTRNALQLFLAYPFDSDHDYQVCISQWCVPFCSEAKQCKQGLVSLTGNAFNGLSELERRDFLRRSRVYYFNR
jgi:hypothetical protein